MQGEQEFHDAPWEINNDKICILLKEQVAPLLMCLGSKCQKQAVEANVSTV